MCGSVTYISHSIDFALYHCHRLKLFLYIKKWSRPEVFVPLRALALVLIPFLSILNKNPLTSKFGEKTFRVVGKIAHFQKTKDRTFIPF